MIQRSQPIFVKLTYRERRQHDTAFPKQSRAVERARLLCTFGFSKSITRNGRSRPRKLKRLLVSDSQSGQDISKERTTLSVILWRKVVLLNQCFTTSVMSSTTQPDPLFFSLLTRDLTTFTSCMSDGPPSESSLCDFMWTNFPRSSWRLFFRMWIHKDADRTEPANVFCSRLKWKPNFLEEFRWDRNGGTFAKTEKKRSTHTKLRVGFDNRSLPSNQL